MTAPSRMHHRRDMSETSRWRPVVAGVVGVLAVLLVAVTLVAVWARAIVVRPEPVTNWATDAIAQPEVQAGLATWMSDQVSVHVDLESRLTDRLPDALDRVAPVIAGATHEVVERTLADVLANRDLDLIERLIGRAHEQAIELLRGDGLRDGISVADGAVTLNLLPLISRGLEQLQSMGLLDDVDLPAITADGDPAEQIDQLSAALERDLPDDFGQLVVYQGASVDSAQQSVQTAQQIVVAAKRALWLLVLASVATVVAAIAIAPRHWRSALYLALGTVGTMVVIRSGVRRVADDGPALVQRPGARAAVETMLADAAGSLLPVLGIAMIVSAMVVLVGLLVRMQWRADLVPVAAVVAMSAAVASVGFSVVGLLLGLALGAAVFVGAHYLLDPVETDAEGAGLEGAVADG